MSNYMTTPEVAAALKRPLSTVQWQAAHGKLPVAFKLPGPTGAYLFDPADIHKIAADEGSENRENRDGVSYDEDRALDQYRRRLFAALVAADGRVRDVSAVEYAPELVDDPDALAAKITSVIESRPEVGQVSA